MMKKIIVATKNQGKIKEMINAFKNLPVELHSLSEFGPLPDAVEDVLLLVVEYSNLEIIHQQMKPIIANVTLYNTLLIKS